MINTEIPVYSIMIFLSLVANIFVVAYTSKKYKFSKIEIICLLLYENTGIIFGAKLLTFLQNYKDLNENFNFLSLGLSSYGAVIGALLFLMLFSFQFKKSLKEMLYVFMPSIPLMYGIGKIGCFLIGCCYGINYDGWGSVLYNYSPVAPKHIHLFPVQIVEAILFIGIFIYLILKHKKNQFDLRVLGIGFILCGFSKFGLDYFRMSHIGKILSLNQIISLVFIVIGIIMIVIKLKKKVNVIYKVD